MKMEKGKTWQASIKHNPMFSKKSQGLLPTPNSISTQGQSSFTNNIFGKKSGLLPLPKPKAPLLKVPLLSTPIKMTAETTKTPLLQTPIVKHSGVLTPGKRLVLSRKRKAEISMQPPNKFLRSNTDSKEVACDKIISAATSCTELVKAYKTHREKLNKGLRGKPEKPFHNTTVSTTPDNPTEPRIVKNEPQYSVTENTDNTPENLSYLANYLLHMKSLSSNDNSNNEQISQKTKNDNDTTVKEEAKCNESQQTISSCYVMSESLDNDIKKPNQFELCNSEQWKENLSNESDSINSVMPTSPVKGKKHKIQLSNYACGNEINSSATSYSLGQNYPQHRHCLTEKTTSKIVSEDNIVHSNTNVCLQNEQVPHSLTSSSDHGKINEEHYKITVTKNSLFSTAVQTELTSLSSSVFSQNCKMVQTESITDEMSVDEGATVSSNGASNWKPHEKKSISTSDTSKISAKDQPYIIPVSGFYCDVCCDFFFDEPSTLQHCKTSFHTSRVKALSKKSKDSAKQPVQEEEETNGETEDSMVIYRKKKKKNSSTLSTVNERRCNKRNSTFTSNSQPQKKKQTSGFLNKSPSTESANRKPFDWNFVIPKKK